jgi:hypothetical protein
MPSALDALANRAMEDGNQTIPCSLRPYGISALFSPPAVVTVAWPFSPACRFHVVENYTFRVAVVAVFSSVDGPVVPAMNWVNDLTVRAQPCFRVLAASMFKELHNPLSSPLMNRLFHLWFLPTS